MAQVCGRAASSQSWAVTVRGGVRRDDVWASNSELLSEDDESGVLGWSGVWGIVLL